MTGDELALLRNIRANPDDDLARLVYADWVEERGDQPMAELIRSHIERERVEPHSPRHLDLVTYAGMLLAQNRDRWTAELRERFGVTGVEFVRGIPEEVEVPLDRFAAVADELFGTLPIRHVKLSGVQNLFDAYRLDHPPGVRRSLTAREPEGWFRPKERDRTTFELLPPRPPVMEPHVAVGRWLVLAFAARSGPDRETAQRWFTAFAENPRAATDGVRRKAAVREFDDPQEFERWHPVPNPQAGPHWIELNDGGLVNYSRGADVPNWAGVVDVEDRE